MIKRNAPKSFVIMACLIIGTLAVLNSCRKDQKREDPIALAKSWYLTDNLKGNTILQSSKGTHQEIKQELDWGNAKTFKLKDGRDVVAVPAKMTLGKGVLGGSYLLFIDQVNNHYRIQVARNAKDDYFQNRSTNLELIEDYTQMMSTTLKDLPRVSNREKLMTIACTNWYMVTTYYDAAGNVQGSTSRFLFQTCSGDLGDYPEPDHGGPVDCAGVLAGGAYATDCGCVGGTTGISECPLREIVDSVENSCIKAQLGQARNAQTTIRNMLNDVFGSSDGFESLNLKFIDVTTLPDNLAGSTKRWSAFSIYFDIYLNKNNLPNYSQEYILSTIYHEILHAYMYSKLTKNSAGIFDISVQHEDMATNYLILMTGALKIAFPNISEQDAWALSWGGLEETSLYITKLTQVQRDAIVEINRKYTNKSALAKKGTYCN